MALLPLMPRYFYAQGIDNFDLALLTKAHFSESKWLQLRLEAFNAPNHAQFLGAPAMNGNMSSASFVKLVSADSPRLIQVAAKFHL